MTTPGYVHLIAPEGVSDLQYDGQDITIDEGGHVTVTLAQAAVLTRHHGFEVDPDDYPAPVIQSVSVATGGTTATLEWDTDQESTSQVRYREQGELDWNETTLADEDPQVTAHSVEITGLDPETLYDFEVESTNDEGTAVLPGKFTTAVADRPTISNVVATPADTSCVITCDAGGTTGEHPSGLIYVAENGGMITGLVGVGASVADGALEFTVGGLDPETEYFFLIVLLDDSDPAVAVTVPVDSFTTIES